MHLTPIRIALAVVPALVVSALGTGISACGQVTGLSDDYVYDLEGGATTTADGAAVDGAKTDGSTTTDGATDSGTDAARKCTQAEAFKAAQSLQSLGGTSSCKACLASSCCTEVETCTNNANCEQVLSCKLDCTTKSSAQQRTECAKGCTISGNPLPQYNNGVGACGAAQCAKECGLQ